MTVLVCNAGSTSLKFKLYSMPQCVPHAEGRIERVGSNCDAIYTYKNLSTGLVIKSEKQDIPDYASGIRKFLGDLTDSHHGAIKRCEEIEAVGFKTVLSKDHYGVHELNEDVLQGMKDYFVVAPAHNGPYLQAIEQIKTVMPWARLIGAFETAFHTTIPKERRIYSLPYKWYEKYGIQKMGYHGASHAYIASRVAEISGRDDLKIISCHLGGSCSLCAIDKGESVDNSFGFSLQAGIPNNNRAGDCDISIIPFLEKSGLSFDEIDRGINKEGGILGLSGVSGDMRYVEEAALNGNERAKLTIDIFCTAIIRYIGSYYAELGGLDYLVFTAGIGEKSPIVRKRVCDSLKHFGIKIDCEKNESGEDERLISADDSKVKVMVIPTNEELIVARKTYEYLQK